MLFPFGPHTPWRGGRGVPGGDAKPNRLAHLPLLYSPRLSSLPPDGRRSGRCAHSWEQQQRQRRQQTTAGGSSSKGQRRRPRLHRLRAADAVSGEGGVLVVGRRGRRPPPVRRRRGGARPRCVLSVYGECVRLMPMGLLNRCDPQCLTRFPLSPLRVESIGRSVIHSPCHPGLIRSIQHLAAAALIPSSSSPPATADPASTWGKNRPSHSASTFLVESTSTSISSGASSSSSFGFGFGGGCPPGDNAYEQLQHFWKLSGQQQQQQGGGDEQEPPAVVVGAASMKSARGGGVRGAGAVGGTSSR